MSMVIWGIRLLCGGFRRRRWLLGHVSVLLRKRGALGNWVRALGPGLLRIATSKNDNCCQQERFRSRSSGEMKTSQN